MDIKKTIQVIFRKIEQESPTILTAAAVGGVFSTMGLAIKATGPAIVLIDRERYGRGQEAPLEPIEIVKLVWKCYLPTAISAGLTITCIIASNRITARRYAALAGLYSLSERALHEYQEKVIEEIGKNKESKIRDSVAEKLLSDNPVENKEVVITGNGKHLFYESISGRYFETDVEAVRRAVNDYNALILEDIYVPLNEYYDLLGLEPIEIGRDIGWEMYKNGQLEVTFTSKLASNNVPCVVIMYQTLPAPI